MEFKPHGSFGLHRDGQLIVVEATGPWNIELIQQYARDVLPVIKEISADGPWGSIVIVKGSILFTTEAAAALREAGFRNAKSSGRVAVSYVVTADVEGAVFAPTIIKHIYEGLNPWSIFADLGDAMVWMRAQLAAHRAAA
jgi:hypothetical protein